MNAHIFDSHSVSCPICKRTSTLPSTPVLGGFYSCPYCQERLVISASGHYVRDPFNFRRLAVGRTLRQQSRPLARVWRDVRLSKRPSLVAVVAGVVAASVTFVTLSGWIPFPDNPFQKILEEVSENIESIH